MAALVKVEGLKKYFKIPKGILHAVDDVTLSFEEGKTMGVVGESGCGKSTLGRTIIHLLESTDGRILFEGKDVTHVKSSQLRQLRNSMQIIFQDPFSSLNPRFTIDDALSETLLRSGRVNSKDLDREVIKLMDMVGIERRLRVAYPHELDGGRRQRVCIGRALSMNPRFVVCDEPVSALDVSIQAQILNLLQDLQQEYKLTYMFVTHNLAVVRHISDEICVMYLGQVVERCNGEDLFKKPIHPYTKALLAAVPSASIHKKKERSLVYGELTSPVNPKPGCRFASRCPYCAAECHEAQALREIEPGHLVMCHKAEEILGMRNDRNV